MADVQMTRMLESNNGFFNTPITACTQILIHSWVLKTKISALFPRLNFLGLVESVAQATACYA